MKQPLLFFLSLFIFIAIQQPSALAQLRDIPVEVSGSFSVLGSGTETPFWHYAQTNGVVSPESSVHQIGSIRAVVPFQHPGDRFDLSFGAEFTTRLSDASNTAHFQQLFGRARLGKFILSAGRFHETIGWGPGLDPLTSGSMMVSNHATPIPKISLQTDGFIDVPWTGGVVSFQGRYSDGKLENDRFVSSPRLHQKSAYLKFTVGQISAVAGFIHNVVWAGEDEQRGRLPRGFGDYLDVVFGNSADPASGATSSEMRNKLGNTVAAYDGGLMIGYGGWRFTGYRQIYLEDTVSLALRSFWDGLYGLGARRQNGIGIINGVVYEFINTIRQDSQADYPRGRANYYGHSVYRSGWTYHGNVLGNPLLTFDRDTDRMSNNMIIAHHVGVDGNISQRLTYRAMSTYTRNYGVCSDQIITGRCFINSERPAPENLETRPRSELREDQVSLLFEGSYLLLKQQQVHIISSVAIDTGRFLGNRTGFMLGVRLNDLMSL
ncbi:MAG: capsule assembly Wzi family protein [Balneolaceae bacterium]